MFLFFFVLSGIEGDKRCLNLIIPEPSREAFHFMYESDPANFFGCQSFSEMNVLQGEIVKTRTNFEHAAVLSAVSG